MRVMGVDLSSRSLAMVTINDNQTIGWQKLKVLDKVKDRQLIAKALYEDGLSFVSESHVDAVFIEEPVVAGARNIRSSLLIAQICGVMMSICASLGMEKVYLVPVSSWKKETVGSGNADKPAVRAWVDQNHPKIAALCGRDQDLYDAACVSLYGQRSLSRVNAIRAGISHGAQLPTVA